MTSMSNQQQQSQQHAPWTSKNSSAKRSFLRDSAINEHRNLFQKARVSNQSTGNNTSLNIKNSNSAAVQKAQLSLDRKNTTSNSHVQNQQSLRVDAQSHLENAPSGFQANTFSQNRKSESKKVYSNTLSNRIDELTHGTSNPNIKNVSHILPESGSYIISQSSRDLAKQGPPSTMANIKNQHLRKYIESREREKRVTDVHKTGGGMSATRPSAIRYSNDLTSKSPNKSSKVTANSRKVTQEKSYTVKKALDQSVSSIVSGKGGNNGQNDIQKKQMLKKNADLDEQLIVVEDLHQEKSFNLNNMSPLKGRMEIQDGVYNLNQFNMQNMAQSPLGFSRKTGAQKLSEKKMSQSGQSSKYNLLKKEQPVKSERSEQRYKNQYLIRSGIQKDKSDDDSYYYGQRGPSRLFNSKSPSKKSIQLQQILKQINMLSSSRPGVQSKKQTATSSALDFKNSTSKSSSLIRNFINQVNNNTNTGQNSSANPHSHTKSIQTIKQNKDQVHGSGYSATRFGTDMKNSGSQNLVHGTDSAQTPSRGNSNRYRHVNPYIQNKNRQTSVIGGKTIITETINSVSRNQMSQDACSNTIAPKNEDNALLTNQTVSPAVHSPLNQKHEISTGLLQNFIVNEPKIQKNRSFINQNQSVKSTSLEKRAHLSGGVTAHTFSSSLKQKIDKKNQQTILQKYQGRVKNQRQADQGASGSSTTKNIIVTDKTSQERNPHQTNNLATDRSDHLQQTTNRRKKTERTATEKAQGNQADYRQSESFIQKSKREPTSGTAKKIKQATAARNPIGQNQQKVMRISRPFGGDISSKQAVSSPSKGEAMNKVPVSQLKFNNQYVSDLKRSSIKDPVVTQPLSGSTILNDQNPQKFAQNMKQSEIVALKEVRLDTSAAQFDTNELVEEFDKGSSGEQVIEHPMENIEDVSMTISHIKTPKKLSDMKSGKPGGASKSTKKKTQKNIQPDPKYTYGKNTVSSSKKEHKHMTVSLSNDLLKDTAKRDSVLLERDPTHLSEQKQINLGTKYQTQASIQPRNNEIGNTLYDQQNISKNNVNLNQNPYKDNHVIQSQSERLNEGTLINNFLSKKQNDTNINKDTESSGGKATHEQPIEGKQPQDLEGDVTDKNDMTRIPVEIRIADSQDALDGDGFDDGEHISVTATRGVEMIQTNYKQHKSKSQQVPEDFTESDGEGNMETQGIGYKKFLEMYRDCMLDEEIQELGVGKNQFGVVYYAGAIPHRTREDVQSLKNGRSYRIKAFNQKKEEARKDLNNGEFQGNPIFDNIEGYYRVEIGGHLAYRFEVLKILGKGSFAQVVQCRDHKSPTKEIFAVKITRNTEMDHKFAHKEAQYLKYIMQEDPHDKHNIVRMVDQTYFREHHCFVFELLHTDLFEHLKATGFVGFSPDKIRDYAVQILKGLVFLEKHKIIHCDLKPENILCADAVCRNLKIVDFGSGCFRDEQIYTYVQSRFYRSPEVILRIKYTEKVDIWSLGCILAELYTGEPLFPGNNEQEQIELIMELCGMPPESMIDLSRKKAHYFDVDYSPYLIEDEELGILRIPNSRSLREAVPCEDKEFLDFITCCIEIDPVRRFSASEAMEHPWIKSALSERQSDCTMRSLNGNQKPHKRMGQNESDEQLWQPQILRDREFREREGQEVIAEQSPEREIIAQRKAPKSTPKDQLFKIQKVNETVTGASRPNKPKKSLGGSIVSAGQGGSSYHGNQIKVVDFIAQQIAGKHDSSNYLVDHGIDIDLQNQQQSSTSFKDSESRDERSSQISLVTDKDQGIKQTQPGFGSNSTIVIQGGPSLGSGLGGLLLSNAQNSTSERNPNHPPSIQPRKSILPQMDYTNKYVVNRHQQSRKDSTDQHASSQAPHSKPHQNTYSVISSQKSFQGQGSTFNRGDNYSTDEQQQAAMLGGSSSQNTNSRALAQKALSQMEQISSFHNNYAENINDQNINDYSSKPHPPN